MRIDTKLNALMLVTQPGEFTLDSESILGDQRVKINNWKDVCIALRVLQEVNWLPDDQHWSTTVILAALRQLLWPLWVRCNCRL